MFFLGLFFQLNFKVAHPFPACSVLTVSKSSCYFSCLLCNPTRSLQLLLNWDWVMMEGGLHNGCGCKKAKNVCYSAEHISRVKRSPERWTNTVAVLRRGGGCSGVPSCKVTVILIWQRQSRCYFFPLCIKESCSLSKSEKNCVNHSTNLEPTSGKVQLPAFFDTK